MDCSKLLLPEKAKGVTPIAWNAEAEEAFRKIKSAITSPPVLAFPRYDGRGFEVQVDARLQGLGAALLQRGDDQRMHPNSFASRKLRPAEKRYPRYSSFKLELLGLKLMWAIRKFRDYTIGERVECYTGNNCLVYYTICSVSICHILFFRGAGYQDSGGWDRGEAGTRPDEVECCSW